jgi:hypothetical protein
MVTSNENGDINELEKIKQDIESQTTKSDAEVDEEELKITMNKTGFVFFFLSIATLGYLIIALIEGFSPFGYDGIGDNRYIYIASDAILTVLIVLTLLFFGLGFYFGWILDKKDNKKDETIEVTDEQKAEEE